MTNPRSPLDRPADRAALRRLAAAGRIGRDEPAVLCVTGSGLKTPDALSHRLSVDMTIRPSLAAFDRAWAELAAAAG